MFDAILQDPELSGLRRAFCCENGVGADLDPKLQDQEGAADPDCVAILKVDHYYTTPRFHNPPPSIDCLIVVRCEAEHCYEMYLVELRNTKYGARVRQRDIRRKFETVVDDFLTRFERVFFAPDARIKRIRLLLVTNPRGAMNENDYRRLVKGSVLDAYGAMAPIVFRGQPLLIEPVMPNPAVCPC